ncbi:MAG: transposase [Actinomycetota bacterium]|nr:transposase [Actinomycetota bacterium]
MDKRLKGTFSLTRCLTSADVASLTRVPKAAQPFVASAVRSIFDQPDASTTREQHMRIADQLAERFGAAAELLEQAGPDILAFTSFPEAHWRQVRSNNPQERLNKEIRRRYMSAESLARARLEVIDGEAVEAVRGELVAAS